MVSDLLRQAIGAEMLTRWLINRLCEIKLRGKKKSVAFSSDSFKHFKYALGKAHFFYIIVFSNSLTCSLNVKQTWHFKSQYNSAVKTGAYINIEIVFLLCGTVFKSHPEMVFHNELLV